MVDRRHFVGAVSTAPLMIAAQEAAGKPRNADLFAIFLEVIRAWRKHDADAVIAHMADDIVWYAYVGAPPITGKAKVRETLASLAPHRGAERWRIFNHAVNGNKLLVEGVDDYDDDKGHRVAVPYMGIVEFRGDLITAWRDYFDVGLLNAMKGGAAVPAAIEPLVSRQGQP